MNNNPLNVPFLINTREFPENDPKLLSTSLGRMYIDVATSVNARVLGIFTKNRPTITGESWFLNSNQRFITFRQVYQFESTSDITIGFKLANVFGISKMSGMYTSSATSSIWYGLIPATSVAIAGQISFYVDTDSGSSDLIKFVTGAGAPALSRGIIILEWLSSV